MKFNEIQDLSTPQKQYSKKEIKKEASSYNIKSIRRYNNLAIIMMLPGVKGSLRNLSTLINNGEKSCSWTCRLTLFHNKWNISIAPHDSIDKSNITINVFDEINKKFNNNENIYINGSLHVASIKAHLKQDVESIINHIISVFSENEISGIEKQTINEKFNIKNSTDPWHLVYDYGVKKENKLYSKQKALIKNILNYDITDEEKIKLFDIARDIKEGKEIDLESLNYLSLKYCTDKERLQIAIKFMS